MENTMLKDLDFPTERMNLFTQSGIDTNKDSIVRTDTNELVSVVSRNQYVIPYMQLAEKVQESFEKSNFKYKLRQSVFTKPHGSAFTAQWTIEDVSILGPDSKEMHPSIWLSSSYEGGSTLIEFGSYRIWCSNGAMHKDILSDIRISPSEQYLKFDLEAPLNRNMERFGLLESKIKDLGEESASDMAFDFLTDSTISFNMKKLVVDEFVRTNKIEYIEDMTKANLTENPDLMKPIAEIDKWEFFNILTYIASHQMRSRTASLSAHRMIDKLKIML